MTATPQPQRREEYLRSTGRFAESSEIIGQLETQAEAVVRMRRNKMLTREIAQELRMPPSSVRRTLQRAGMVKRWNR